MLTNRLLNRTARLIKRGGFTLVELLVVIGIIAILAGVALGPITNGIKQAKHNSSMQLARQLGQVEFSYATDNTANGNLYPANSSSTALCQALINSNYVTDPSIFCVSGAVGGQQVASASGGSVSLGATNVTWNFTVLTANTTGGLSSAASDLIPLVYFTGQTATFSSYPSSLTLSASASVFGTDGVAVFYKGNNAAYLKSGTGGSTGVVSGFISADCTDTTAYTTITP